MKNLLLLILIIWPLFFTVSCNSRTNDAHLDDVQSDTHNEEVTPAGTPEPGIITDTIKKGSFHSVLKTGGVVQAGYENIVLVTAKSSGIVKFNKPAIYPGTNVKKDQVMFTISGESLTEDNPVLRTEQLRSDLEKAKENYERAQKLLPDRIITREQFLSARNEYEKLVLEYENISSTYSGNQVKAVSAVNGFVREVFVKEGQKVSTGETLASVQTTGSMVLRALVPPDKMNIIPSFKNAWFTVSGSDKLFKTEELNGIVISSGKSIGEKSLQIPLLFRIDFIPEVPDGSFAVVYLKGEEIKDAVTVPDGSVMEEFGRFYVFVKDEDGDFIKRYITTGAGDGERTLVTGGLKEGEVIVSEGAYQVKLGQMQGSVPAHVHNH